MIQNLRLKSLSIALGGNTFYGIPNWCVTSSSPLSPITQNSKQLVKNNLPYSISAPEGPPLNFKVTAESSSSLSVTWEPPEKDKRNGKIVSYTVCVSHEENKPCFIERTTDKKTLLISSLNPSTKYYVRVLASTKVGRGNYSKSEHKSTNASKSSLIVSTDFLVMTPNTDTRCYVY